METMKSIEERAKEAYPAHEYCVFRDKQHCKHPHYYDGTKGCCRKPYREVKEKMEE